MEARRAYQVWNKAIIRRRDFTNSECRHLHDIKLKVYERFMSTVMLKYIYENRFWANTADKERVQEETGD